MAPVAVPFFCEAHVYVQYIRKAFALLFLIKHNTGQKSRICKLQYSLRLTAIESAAGPAFGCQYISLPENNNSRVYSCCTLLLARKAIKDCGAVAWDSFDHTGIKAAIVINIKIMPYIAGCQ